MKLLNILYKVNAAPSQSFEAGSTYLYNISLLADSVIYKAHFPDSPITPGACLIGIVKELSECLLGRSLKVAQIRNLKFLVPVYPSADGSEKLVDVSIKLVSLSSESVSVQAVISDDETTYTKLSLFLI